MIDAPAIVQPAPNAIREQVLAEYAQYYYGVSNEIRHSSERLRLFAKVAWEYELLTIADYFERLAEREQQNEDREDLRARASQQMDERDLHFIYS